MPHIFMRQFDRLTTDNRSAHFFCALITSK